MRALASTIWSMTTSGGSSTTRWVPPTRKTFDSRPSDTGLSSTRSMRSTFKAVVVPSFLVTRITASPSGAIGLPTSEKTSHHRAVRREAVAPHSSSELVTARKRDCLPIRAISNPSSDIWIASVFSARSGVGDEGLEGGLGAGDNLGVGLVVRLGFDEACQLVGEVDVRLLEGSTEESSSPGRTGSAGLGRA